MMLRPCWLIVLTIANSAAMTLEDGWDTGQRFSKINSSLRFRVHLRGTVARFRIPRFPEWCLSYRSSPHRFKRACIYIRENATQKVSADTHVDSWSLTTSLAAAQQSVIRGLTPEAGAPFLYLWWCLFPTAWAELWSSKTSQIGGE